jgi:hypothetical protein
MVVEPESQCWLPGRLSDSRDGEQWAKELQQLPALEHLVRDGGKGLQNGLARVNRQRRQDKRLLLQPETYAYLDRLKRRSEALPVSPEVREAVVRSEGIRQDPQLVAGGGPKRAVLRGLLLVRGVLIARAGAVGQQAVQALRQAVRDPGRASSCVEGLNSVVRMQQARHRQMTQGLLNLKRLYWNLRKFRTGRRKDSRP